MHYFNPLIWGGYRVVTTTLLTTSIFLWTPSKILDSLTQILKLSLRESSIHTAIASWGLSGVWWLGLVIKYDWGWQERLKTTQKTFHKTLKVLYYIFDKLLSNCTSSFISREK